MPVTMDENGELQPVGPTRISTGKESDDRLTPPEVWAAVDAMIGLNRYPVYDVVPYEDDERCPDGWFGRDALDTCDWPPLVYCNLLLLSCKPSGWRGSESLARWDPIPSNCLVCAE